MIGGTVIETIVLPDKVWINCRDKHSTSECAIYVHNDSKARSVSDGDTVWWQSGVAMWTPEFMASEKVCDHKHHYSCRKAGIDYDIRLKRIGFSGVSRPNQAKELATTP